MAIFTNEMITFVRDNCKGIQSSELADMLNKEFGTSVTAKQIKSFKKRKKLTSGIEIMNKGVDIGTVSKIDGFICVKTSDGWKRKHRLIYEEHYGEIPEGHALIFLDGNKNNIEIKNLKLVTRKEMLYMNKNHMFSSNPQITEVNCTIAKLMCKKQELVNKRKKDERT